MSETLTPQNQSEAVKTVPEVDTGDIEGQLVLEQLYSSPELVAGHSDLSLQGHEALQRKLFLNTSGLKGERPDVIVNAADFREPIEVPLDLVVDAQSFMSWEGRGAKVNKTIMTDEGYSTLPSREVIARYAGMQGDAPVIPEFDMFVQPDGKVFLANSNDGSHRLAAAVFNGRKTVPTLSLRVRHIPDLIF